MTPITPAEIQKWRQEFPILSTTIHLANCSQSPQSKTVRHSIEAYLRSWREEGMNWDAWIGKVDAAKKQFAKLINAETDEIAVTMSVSDATINVASACLPEQWKNKIVTTAAEFPTIGQIWLAQQRFGWQVEFVPVRDGQLYLEDYWNSIDDRTALVSVTHVYYQNGFKQDLGAIAKLAHARGALFYVDAYQSLGTTPVDVKAMQIDMLSSGVLKYLLGLPGIAFLYVRRDLADKLRPASTGWFGQQNPFAMEVSRLDYATGARRFDTGTPPIIAAYAAEAGLSLINQVGDDRIHQRLEQLVQFTLQQAAAQGLTVLGPSDLSQRGATVAINVPDSHHLEARLKQRGMILSARGPAIRIAPHFFTLEEEISRAVVALREELDRTK